ncbi:LCP family protein [Actinomycetospora sp. CA-084318]|uniref:LCP family protein n=1 Tax=Actinomycetospora sp. CA-084318 TaxID=3239892 RepID=UPI003D964B1E
MTDDRERGAGPGVPAARSSETVRTGPPSVPTRVVVGETAVDRRGGVAPTMVPLARKRPGRRSLRPAGAAAETEPMRDLVAAAAAADEPAGPPSELPTIRTAAPVVGKPGPREAQQAAPAAPDPAPRPAREPAAPPAVGKPSAPPATTAEPAPPREAHQAAPAAPEPAPRPPREPAAPTAAPRAVLVPDGDATGFAATSAVLSGVGTRVRTRIGPWTWARTLRLTTVAMSTVIVLVCGVAWGATSWFEAAVKKIGALDPTSASIIDPAAQAGDQNFLVVGSDTRVGAPPSEDVGDATDVPGARSDTVMIVHVPANRARMTVVSFPRDLEIDRPACERWDSVSGAYTGQTIPRAPRMKLNSAYQVGGPRCVTKVVQELSGLAVNHFLGVDFSGFKDMVDAVEGVPVCLEKPLRDTVLGTVVPRAGTSVLTGDQALGFVRARHVVGDPTSDYGRINRQQIFLSALLRKTLSAGTLLDVGKLRGLVDAVGRSTYGENIEAAQLLSLGQSLSGLDARAVTFTTVPTTGVANARGNEVLRTVDNRSLFDAIINDTPLPGQPGATPTGPPPAPPVPAERVALRLVDARSATSTGDDGSGDATEVSASGESGSTRSASGSDDDGSGSSDDGGGDGSRDDEGSGFRRDVGGRLGAQQGPSAGSVAGSLRGYGFTVTSDVRGSTAAAATDSRTTIRFTPDQAGAAATLQKAVPGAVLDPRAGAGALVLELGDDFDGRVVDPTAPAPTAPLPTLVNAADSTCR